MELNRLFVAWVETEYHRRVHTETGQSPLDRWEAGWDRLGRTPAMPTADELTEAFLWSEYRVVTKTATVSLHANTYQVDPALVGRKVELVFSPFDLETVEVRYRDKSYGKALPHTISRHTHPKATIRAVDRGARFHRVLDQRIQGLGRKRLRQLASRRLLLTSRLHDLRHKTLLLSAQMAVR
ncbi:putative transposase [Mycobacterium xenopi RIVM700367]|nr:putative transposase [Mycobacterium xenopi RIVM700367]